VLVLCVYATRVASQLLRQLEDIHYKIDTLLGEINEEALSGFRGSNEHC